ncbi:cytochrome P450 [Mycena metata]|uniref:Cytochrome P450 n=1 Tax=Mycena metata TaxID=1033252 RepID=A0AAD7JJF3_9AGAR|nr:cytochrome P450 [Mycena metata]
MSPFPVHSLWFSIALIPATALPVLLIYTIFRPSTIRNIPGPPSQSWIFGNTLQLLLPTQYGDYEFRWLKSYGPVYRLKNCFGDRLMVADPAALNCIVNSPHFKPSPMQENMFEILFGRESLSCVSVQEHKALRAALNVGFSAVAVRSYQSIFEKAAARLTEELENSSSTSTIDICPLLGFAMLSTIGEAVLGQSPEELGEELIRNNFEIVAVAASQSRQQILAEAIASHLPTWLFRAVARLPTGTFKTVRDAKRLAYELGNRIVQEKLVAAKEGLDTDSDVFGVLLNLNASSTTRTGLPGNVVAAQTAVFMIAGQETTANTITLGLRALARLPEFQAELRSEITAKAGNAPYDGMPLLNAFIKESLRMFPVVPIDDRCAREDTVIPLSEKITLSTGEEISQIHVEKGQVVSVAIAAFQRLESRWGEDAHEFNPNRWLQGSSAYKGAEGLGPYANLMSFLGGPHVCLGWRFAVLEMQVFICELVRQFSFALPEDDNVRVRLATTLHTVMASGQTGSPMIVSRVS